MCLTYYLDSEQHDIYLVLVNELEFLLGEFLPGEFLLEEFVETTVGLKQKKIIKALWEK